MTKKIILTFAFLVLTGSLTTLYGSQMPKKQKFNYNNILFKQIIMSVEKKLKNDSTPYTEKTAEKFWDTHFSYLYRGDYHDLCFMVVNALNEKIKNGAEDDQNVKKIIILNNFLLLKHMDNNCKQCKQVIVQLTNEKNHPNTENQQETNNTEEEEDDEEDKTND